jgi:peptidoglycan lytic transglycosylase F
MRITRPGLASGSFHFTPWQLAGCVLLILIFACGADHAGRATTTPQDLPGLVERGTIRILSPEPVAVSGLPRRPLYVALERRLAEAFVLLHNAEPEWVWVDQYDDLVPALQDGRGDIIAANFTVTPARAAQIAFSHPLTTVRERLVANVSSPPLDSVPDLAGREVVVRQSSSFWETLQGLQRVVPGFTLIPAPEELDTEEILHRITTGQYDVSVADENVLDEVLPYMPALRPGPVIADSQTIAWGIRQESPRLLAAVNQFVRQVNPGAHRSDVFTGDLDSMKTRRVLRVLTRNNATSYFVLHGELMGFEHDLVRELAKRLGVQAEFIVVPTRAALMAWLIEGRGDMIAAGMTITETRQDLPVSFSRPYDWVREMLVARPADSTLDSVEDLNGRTIVVRRSSSYWGTVESLRNRGVDVRLENAPEDMETEEIIGLVADGTYDLTVSDSDILAIEQSWRDDVIGAFALGDSVPHAWVVREANTQLIDSVNAFIRAEYRGLVYNITRDKYFGSERRTRARATERAARTGTLSPYDDLARTYADRYGFEWPMVVSQMYQESRFDPEARSFAGAEGLMQVLPKTARGFGFDSLTVPDRGVHAGVFYLRHVYDLIDSARTDEDHLWFSLAAYNAGYGHLSDARRLAAELGHDPNAWFGEVAAVMPLLTRRRYHSTTRYGYCRCMEPVQYVFRIRERNEVYVGELAEAAADSGR